MPRFKIMQVGSTSDWQSKQGAEFRDYDLTLMSEDREELNVFVTQKPETTPPKAGDIVEGHIEDHFKGKKFKKEYSGGGGGHATSGGRQEYDDTGVKIGWAWNIACSYLAAQGEPFDRKVLTAVAAWFHEHQNDIVAPDTSDFGPLPEEVPADLDGLQPIKKIPPTEAEAHEEDSIPF